MVIRLLQQVTTRNQRALPQSLTRDITTRDTSAGQTRCVARQGQGIRPGAHRCGPALLRHPDRAGRDPGHLPGEPSAHSQVDRAVLL